MRYFADEVDKGQDKEYSQQISSFPTSLEQRERIIQNAFYASFEDEQVLKLLQFVEMIIFHSLILLISSKE